MKGHPQTVPEPSESAALSSASAPSYRAEGVTEAERYLQRLGERSFLRMWSYAGVFRDQGRALKQVAGQGAKSGERAIRGGDGKELCDLLVVFQDHLIIFSDKNCAFPETESLDLDWRRWYKRAVLGGARQLWGAERWIKSYPGTLYLDRACTQPFPFELPHLDRMKVHRVLVAHGAAERCRREFGGSGSLMLQPDIVGDQHMLPREQGGKPFAIGQIDPSEGFVHVLDDTSLDIVLGTLDTVADFVAYLEKKEAFIRSGRLVGATGEEDLLAFYLVDINEAGEHDFIIPSNIGKAVILEGEWESFSASRARKSQVEADKVSYFWDSLIEEFTKHAFAGSQHYTTDSSIMVQEQILRFLAREPRTRRRMLADKLLEIMGTTPPGAWRTRVMLPSKPGDPHYVFLTLPAPPIPHSYEEYRLARLNLLEACCRAAKLEFPDALDVIGIATEPFPFEQSSQDIIYFDASYWPEELREDSERVRDELRLLRQIDKVQGTIHEYPDASALPASTGYPDDRIIFVDLEPDDELETSPRVAPKYTGERPGPNPRNKPCPCGSGHKYKKCCRR